MEISVDLYKFLEPILCRGYIRSQKSEILFCEPDSLKVQSKVQVVNRYDVYQKNSYQ